MITPKQAERNRQRIAELDPEMQDNVNVLLLQLAHKGVYFIVTHGYRSIMDQDDMWFKGRETPGVPCHCNFGAAVPVGKCKRHPLGLTVTDAKGGESWHNYRRGIDLALVKDDGRAVEWFDRDNNHDGVPDYTQMGELAESLGFVWGGRWKRRDLCHLEYHPGLKLEDMKNGKDTAV